VKNKSSRKHGSPSNYLTDENVFAKMLEAMTEEELTDGLNEVLESITAENYDPALIDAYLAALDQKSPMPEVPDTDTSFVNFKNKLFLTFPAPSNRTSESKHSSQSIWRVGLIAALTAICLVSSMVVAQAAGVDIFGAIARWTNEVFSLGVIHSDGADDGTSSPADGGVGSSNEATYTSLQEVLDDYGIAEFTEPTWFPDGYEFKDVMVDCWPDDNKFIGLSASYSDGSDTLLIDVKCYQHEQPEQLQKTDAAIESFVAGGLTVYLLENINSNSAAWVTEHYECYISGTVEGQTLKQIVLSAYVQIQ